jgi:RNA-binding protein NOB1
MYVTVTEFSKKTGDYPSLSATDIKVMALAYQLEKEGVGTDHLKKEPQVNRSVTFMHHLPDESKATAGFYAPGKKVCIKLFSNIVELSLNLVLLGLYS